MRNLTLVLCLVALAGSVASGILFFLIGNSKQEMFQRWQDTDAQLTASQLRVGSLEASLDELNTRNRTLDADLAAAKREITDQNLKMSQLQDALDLTEEARREAVTARETAIENLAAAHVELNALRDQLAGSISPMEAQRYRRTIADLEARTGELEQFISRQNRDPALIAGRAQHAQVLRVGPQNAFVVINFGANHGAGPNQRIQIQRGTEPLAQAEISLVKEHYSIAQVLAGTLSGNLRKGDAAFLTP